MATQKKKKAKSALAFIQQAKETLSPPEYKLFQSYIRQYKQKTLPIENLVDNVTKLFDLDEKRHLLNGFGTFVPPKYKETYNNILNSIMNKTNTKLTKEELKNEELVIIDKNTTKSTSIRIEDNIETKKDITFVKEDILQTEIEENEPSSSSKMKIEVEEQDIISQSPSQFSSSTTILTKSFDLITGKPTSKKPKKGKPKVSVQTKSEPILKSSATPPGNKKEVETDIDEEMDDYLDQAKAGNTKCTICQCPPVAPFTARCGHICCKACWDQWLAEQLTCPVCRERVRQKQLTKLFFC